MTVEREVRSGLDRVRRVVESLPFRVLVTCGLLGLVAAQIDWSRMGSRVSHGHPLYFLAAVALVLAALVIGAGRWLRLLRGADLAVRVRDVARIYAVATFSNTFLPTSVGGDVTRTLLVARRGPLLTRTAISVIVDRFGGLAGLLGMGWLALAIHSANVPRGATIFLAWVTAAVVLATALVGTAVLRGSRVARALVPQRFLAHAVEIRALLHVYAREPWTLIVLFCTSLLYQALISLQLVMLADSIGLHLAYATAAVVLALVTVVTLIPISIGGFGVREGTYVVLLGGASIGATDATLISILSVAALFIASLPGAFMLARGGIAPALRPVSS
jgi:uncharacterized protein (TIRG00374 family)